MLRLLVLFALCHASLATGDVSFINVRTVDERRASVSAADMDDLGAILSGDFCAGPVMRPDFTQDPTGGHPNLAPGELAMAKGFILAPRDALRWEKRAGATAQVGHWPTGRRHLTRRSPQRKAMRVMLDRNG